MVKAKYPGVGQGIGGGRVKFWTEDKIDALAEKLIIWIQQPQNFWLGDFAAENLCWLQRFDEFENENEKFAEAYRIAKQMQMNKLVKGALGNKLNATMTIFTLKNVSRWTDKTDLNIPPSKTIINLVTNHVPDKPAPALPGPPKAKSFENGQHLGPNGHKNGYHQSNGHAAPSVAIPDAETDASESDA